MTQEASEGGEVVGTGVRCRYCGSPLQVGPDTVVAVCPYCGRPNWLRGDSSELLAPKPLTKDEVSKGFMEFARKDPDLRKLSIEPARVEVVLVPFYQAKGVAVSHYEASGTLTITITRSSEGKTYTTTETRPFRVSGTYVAGFEALTLGKRTLGEEAVDELAEYYLSSKPELRSLSDIEWRKGEYVALSADYTVEEAESIVRDSAADWLRERVEWEIRRRAEEQYSGPGTVTSVNVVSKTITCGFRELEVRGPVFLPLSKVFYVYEGKFYRAYFSGWDMKPLVREEPFTATQRALFLALAGIAGGLGGGLAAAALAYLHGTVRLAAAGLALIAGAAAGYLTSRAGLASARVEKGASGTWIKSVVSTIEGA